MAQKVILIIDDSRSMREVLVLTLKMAGYDVVEAVDGKDALDKLDGRKIHLMICDVNMPVMDGITFMQEAKKLTNYRFVPIIMLTTESRESRKQEGMEAGANAWMVKPFQREQLLQVVTKFVLP
jgi:two-component system, chemotaxis family, chemotaxis protein CheY